MENFETQLDFPDNLILWILEIFSVNVNFESSWSEMEILKSFSMFTLKPTSGVSDSSSLIFEKCGLSNTFPQTMNLMSN